jgi:hypothetical protein
MKYYWTTKTGEKIDVDEMTTQHLRNVLKMLIRVANKEDRLVIHATDEELNDSNIRKSFRESEIEDMYRDIDYYDL